MFVSYAELWFLQRGPDPRASCSDVGLITEMFPVTCLQKTSPESPEELVHPLCSHHVSISLFFVFFNSVDVNLRVQVDQSVLSDSSGSGASQSPQQFKQNQSGRGLSLVSAQTDGGNAASDGTTFRGG